MPKVSTAGAAVAWSTFDAARSEWFLVIRRDGVTESTAVAARAAPFDVDLGRDGDGRLVAAYSRCRVEPRVFAPTGRGCDLYVYDVDAGAERKVAGASTDQASEYLASLAGGHVAFARAYEQRPGGRGRRSYLYVRPLSGGGSRRLSGGTMNEDERTGPTALDLDARRLAFGWDVHRPAGSTYGYGTSEVRLDDLHGGRTIVELNAQGNVSAVGFLTPTLLDGTLYYGRNYLGDGDGPTQHQFRRYVPAPGRAAPLRRSGGWRGRLPMPRRWSTSAARPRPMSRRPRRAATSCRATRSPTRIRIPSWLARHGPRRRAPTPAAWRSAPITRLPAATVWCCVAVTARSRRCRWRRGRCRSTSTSGRAGRPAGGRVFALSHRAADRAVRCHGPALDRARVRSTPLRRRRPTRVQPARRPHRPGVRVPAVDLGERGGLRPGLRAAHGAARARAVPLRPIALRGASTRLAGGSRGVDGGPGPRAIDQYGRRVGFVWDYRPDAGRYVSEVRLDTQRPRHRALSPEPDPTGG